MVSIPNIFGTDTNAAFGGCSRAVGPYQREVKLASVRKVTETADRSVQSDSDATADKYVYAFTEGRREMADIEAGTDFMLATGTIDPKRMVATGGSYVLVAQLNNDKLGAGCTDD